MKGLNRNTDYDMIPLYAWQIWNVRSSLIYHEISRPVREANSKVEPSSASLLVDGSGLWHSELTDKWLRINVVFADGHFKLDDYYQFSNSLFKTN